MLFKNVADEASEEIEDRRSTKDRLLPLGIDFLDDALYGIFPNDLILVGASSGLGKTQLMCNIALSVLEEGKKVHYIALEAEPFEISRRMKYRHFADSFYADPNRTKKHCSYDEWRIGQHIDELKKYEEYATEYSSTAYKFFEVYYKRNKFDCQDLIEAVYACADDTDLIIVDHVHYFDMDDDNENRAIKTIAKTARTLCLEQGKPMILVSHLRKKDRGNDQLVPGLEEFHGSSDLYKIATKVVTMSAGQPLDDGNFTTYFSVPKNRINGGVPRYCAELTYNPRKGNYEKGYRVGYANQHRGEFQALSGASIPSWARRASAPSSFNNQPQPPIPRLVPGGNRKKSLKNFYEKD